MDVQVEDISPVKKKISVEVSADYVSDEITKAYKKIAKNAKVKGFRQGKVPMNVVEQYYAEQMEREVVGKLINESYYKALVDNDVQAICEPKIEATETLTRGKSFTFEAHVEVKPEVELQNYTGFDLDKEILALDDQVVEDRICEMTSARDSQEVAERDDVQNGDFVTIDFEGFLDGEAFAGGAAQEHVLELGSGSFIPGFEEQLVGMNRGDEKEITVTFPEEYGNDDLAGKEAVFKVKIREIKVKVCAELNDELAKELGGESVEDLRQKVADGYKDQEESRIEEELKERLMTALVDNNEIEVPETMIGRQLDFMKRNITNRLKQQGMTLEMMGMNDESFRDVYRETAIKQIQGSLILEAVGKQENISVDESEIDGRLEEIATMANAPLDEVKKYYAAEDARKNLLAQIEEEKVITYLLGQSNINDISKEDLAAKKEEGADEQSEAQEQE
ncbi:MAG: trigger factor [Desulfobacteraceae bacterium 4572_35.1]|nr:MAG: trigger factor [Desulfobacteraceae bacterium 4572_35.1]